MLFLYSSIIIIRQYLNHITFMKMVWFPLVNNLFLKTKTYPIAFIYSTGDKITFASSGKTYDTTEVGVMYPTQVPSGKLWVYQSDCLPVYDFLSVCMSLCFQN